MSDVSDDRSSWEDYDGRRWVTLTSSKDAEGLKRLASKLVYRVWPSASREEVIQHLCDDIQVVMNLDSTICLPLDTWRGLTPIEREKVQSFVEGFVEALDD
jgi:hypothetical protein